MKPKWEGKKGRGSATKRWKRDRITKKDRAIRETEWHKDKVT